MRYTYTSADAAYVRNLIDPLASVETIPDASLLNEHGLIGAEAWAFGTLAPVTGDDLDTEEDQTVRTAVLVYLASQLIDETPVIVRGNLGEGSFQLQPGDPARRASRLKARAREMLLPIRELLVPAAPRRTLTVFTTAKGGRGR